MRVLVVGQDNVFVSPTIAALLYHEARRRPLPALRVASAGFGRADRRMAEPVAALLVDRGVDVARKRSRRLDDDLVAGADLVLTTTAGVAERVLAEHGAEQGHRAPGWCVPFAHFVGSVEPRHPRVTVPTWLRRQCHMAAAMPVTTRTDLPAPAEPVALGALLEFVDVLLGLTDGLADAAWPGSVVDE